MTIDSGTQAIRAEDRIAGIRDRLAVLRQQTTALTERAQDASRHTKEIRAVAPGQCNHAHEAAAMRAELEVLGDEIEGLRLAMDTRGVIEQAKGMLMLQSGCDADTAFGMLVSMSQTSHKKLVEIARAVVDTLPRNADARA